MMWSRNHEQARLPGFNRAINLLKEVSKSEVTHHRALAHAYLGTNLIDFWGLCVNHCSWPGVLTRTRKHLAATFNKY